MRHRLFSYLLFLSAPLPACAKEPPAPPPGVLAVRDLDYSGSGNPRQKLDLYLPEKPADKPLPLIVYIHGGGWEAGSKEDAGILDAFIKDGKYAAASIGYRLTQEQKWPAQIHDVKAALRWLGAHAKDHGFDPNRIGLIGISAGGHLVSLLGTSQGVTELEGTVGTQSPAPKIACIANFCGPANFITFPGKGSIIDPEKPGTAITKLFGGPMSQHLEVAKAASPITYIDKDDPPFVHIHGTKDTLVPYEQAQEFDAALDKAGVSSTLLSGEGGPHVFFSLDLITKLRAFFDQHLLGLKTEVKEGPVAVQ